MPRQPLYNEGSPVRTQPGQERMVTGAGAGRGVTLDESAFIGSVKAPLLDDSGAIAEGRGLAALGQGISDATNPLMDYMREAAKARNFNMVNDTRNKMDMADAMIQKQFAEEPNTMKWPGIAQKAIAEMPQTWDNPDAPPIVKDEVAAMTERWRTKVSAEALLRGAQIEMKKKEDTRDAIHRNALAGAVLGDADAVTRSRMEDGTYTEEQGRAELESNKRTVERNRQVNEANARATRVRNMQDAAVEMLDKGTSLEAIIHGTRGLDSISAIEQDDIIREVRSAFSSRQQDAVDQVSKMIFEGVEGEDGKMRTATEHDIDGLQNRYLTPDLREKSKDILQRSKQEELKKIVAANAPFYAAQLSDEIRSYDPKSDENNPEGPQKKYRIQMRIAALPVPLRADLRAALDRRIDPVKGSAIPKVPTEHFMDLIQTDMDEGRLGYLKPKKLTESEQSAVIAEAKKDGRKLTAADFETKEDFPAKRKALEKMSLMREEFLQWGKDNPDAKLTDPETKKEMERIRSKHIGGGFDYVESVPSAGAPPAINKVDKLLQKYGAKLSSTPAKKPDVSTTAPKDALDRLVPFGPGTPVPELPDNFDDPDYNQDSDDMLVPPPGDILIPGGTPR